MIRLDRFLSQTEGVTRTQASALIRAGRVTVDGIAVKKPETRIMEDAVSVCLDGSLCSYRHYRFLILDKPSGVLTACSDKRQRTVMDLLPPDLLRCGISPVGRLDKDTSGLLLLTNHGEFAHRIIAPKYGVRKKYYAEVESDLEQKDIELFRSGIVLRDGTECLPAELEILGPRSCCVTVQEGKYHQVKRMLAAAGKPVLSLRRLEIGGLRLDSDSKEGQLREMTDQELCMMFKLVGLE